VGELPRRAGLAALNTKRKAAGLPTIAP